MQSQVVIVSTTAWQQDVHKRNDNLNFYLRSKEIMIGKKWKGRKEEKETHLHKQHFTFMKATAIFIPNLEKKLKLITIPWAPHPIVLYDFHIFIFLSHKI